MTDCRADDTNEECTFRANGGEQFIIRVQRAAERDRLEDDERRFDGIAGLLSNVFALLAALFVTWLLSSFISRRLLGTGLRKHVHDASLTVSAQHAVLFYSRWIPSEEVNLVLRGLRPGTISPPPAITRVNLATKAFQTELAPERALAGKILLTNLDIALADASRRREILDTLERLVENPGVQLMILCRRSPIEQLYHPERYPEAGPQHVMAVDESLRWDNVLQKFECRDVENLDAPRTHPYLATIDHHRTWKLCSRSERLLLYELARGRLANPRNTGVIEALRARGLLKLDPWPKIADPNFENFVRTAETTEEVAQWQQDLAQASGRRWRSTVMAILLLLLLLSVIWFSWSAGDKFKVLSAIVAGAVAFLGQIGQAFNFVRSGAGSGGRGGS
jgi:hypothetical protein